MKKRGEGKTNASFGRNDMFKHYSTRSEDMVDRFKVSPTKHSLILNKFNKEVSRMMLEEAFDFLLPHRIGTMRIKKYKPTLLKKNGELNIRHLSVDWKKTNEMWENDTEAKKLKKVVYYENNHSEGYNYRWYFSNYRSLCKNKSAYCFKPTRTNKRHLASLVKDPDFKGDFYE
jgi:hypothetical protein|tara:strand:- start:734 stop:1252 length:519 start_codon:yes stop_codon:yes gene_type:complete